MSQRTPLPDLQRNNILGPPALPVRPVPGNGSRWRVRPDRRYIRGHRPRPPSPVR